MPEQSIYMIVLWVRSPYNINMVIFTDAMFMTVAEETLSGFPESWSRKEHKSTDIAEINRLDDRDAHHNV